MRIFIIIVGLMFPVLGQSEEFNIPHTFEPGEKASSSQVNENFSSLVGVINENKQLIESNTSSKISSAEIIEGKQNKIQNSCVEGSSIRVINSDGSVECEIDDIGSVNTVPNGITNVIAGQGLSGTSSAGEVTLSVDSSKFQQKLQGATCSSGNYIESISDSGAVTCSSPTPTSIGLSTVTATSNSGITTSTVSGSVELSVNNTLIQRRVTGSCTIGQVITAINENGSVTCSSAPTDVTAGAGISQNVNADKSITLSVNQSYTQRRLNSACSAGSSIRDISEDGTPICETDTDTTYSAGNGITFDGTTINNSIGIAIENDPAFSTILQTNLGVTEVVRVSTTVPSAGHILVSHTGVIVTKVTPNEIFMGIGNRPTVMDTFVELGVLEGTTNRYKIGYSINYLYSVGGAGTYTYYGLAQKDDVVNGGDIKVSPQSMTALFIPNIY